MHGDGGQPMTKISLRDYEKKLALLHVEQVNAQDCPMDLKSRQMWADYSRAKDEMFAYTDTKQSPWCVVDSDVKKHARLNCISHFLSMVPYDDLTPEPIVLEPRPPQKEYVRPQMEEQSFVPEVHESDDILESIKN